MKKNYEFDLGSYHNSRMKHHWQLALINDNSPYITFTYGVGGPQTLYGGVYQTTGGESGWSFSWWILWQVNKEKISNIFRVLVTCGQNYFRKKIYKKKLIILTSFLTTYKNFFKIDKTYVNRTNIFILR